MQDMENSSPEEQNRYCTVFLVKTENQVDHCFHSSGGPERCGEISNRWQWHWKKSVAKQWTLDRQTGPVEKMDCQSEYVSHMMVFEKYNKDVLTTFKFNT